MPETPNLDAQVNGPQYLGPATFMKVRALTEPAELERAAPDVAIVGAPWDDGTTYRPGARFGPRAVRDRKSTRLNSSHSSISYAVFCLKKKKTTKDGLSYRNEKEKQSS